MLLRRVAHVGNHRRGAFGEEERGALAAERHLVVRTREEAVGHAVVVEAELQREALAELDQQAVAAVRNLRPLIKGGRHLLIEQVVLHALHMRRKAPRPTVGKLQSDSVG